MKNAATTTKSPAPGTDEDQPRCAFCSDPLTGRDELRCARCRTRYHRRCWSDYRRCAVYGCASRAFLVPDCSAAEESTELISPEHDAPPAVEFTRRNPFLTTLLALMGGTLGLLLLVIAFEIAYLSGLFSPDAVHSFMVAHMWKLFAGAYAAGALLLAGGARERLRIDFETRRVLVRGEWFGISGLRTELASLDDVLGIQVDRGRKGKLDAYIVIAHSQFSEYSLLSRKLFTESIADAAQSWLGRTHIQTSPTGDEGQRAWLENLEALTASLDTSLRLPNDEPLLALLPPPPKRPSLPPADDIKEKAPPEGPRGEGDEERE